MNNRDRSDMRAKTTCAMWGVLKMLVESRPNLYLALVEVKPGFYHLMEVKTKPTRASIIKSYDDLGPPSDALSNHSERHDLRVVLPISSAN